MSIKKLLIVVVIIIVTVLLATAASFLLFFRLVGVPSGGMANTIMPGELVMCAMRINQIKRGDIVVFKFPADPRIYYIKRIIGLPGETIQFRGTKVYNNGQELSEARTLVELGDGKGVSREISSEGAGPYRVYYVKRDSTDDEIYTGYKNAMAEPFKIPLGHYFVLGDSRDNSLDSRSWGTVPRELIVGQALMIVGSESTSGQKGEAEARSGRMFKRLE